MNNLSRRNIVSSVVETKTPELFGNKTPNLTHFKLKLNAIKTAWDTEPPTICGVVEGGKNKKQKWP